MPKQLFAVFAIAGLLVVGCGGDDTGGTDDAGATGNDLAGARLESGTYNVTNVQKITDECGLDLVNNSGFMTTQVVNTGDMLSIGRKYDSTTEPSFTPPGYAQGSGVYTTATTASLTVTSHVKYAEDGCEFDTTHNSAVTFVGMNHVTIDFTAVNSNGNKACTDGGLPASCSSHFTFELKM